MYINFNILLTALLFVSSISFASPLSIRTLPTSQIDCEFLFSFLGGMKGSTQLASQMELLLDENKMFGDVVPLKIQGWPGSLILSSAVQPRSAKDVETIPGFSQQLYNRSAPLLYQNFMDLLEQYNLNENEVEGALQRIEQNFSNLKRLSGEDLGFLRQLLALMPDNESESLNRLRVEGEQLQSDIEKSQHFLKKQALIERFNKVCHGFRNFFLAIFKFLRFSNQLTNDPESVVDEALGNSEDFLSEEIETYLRALNEIDPNVDFDLQSTLAMAGFSLDEISLINKNRSLITANYYLSLHGFVPPSEDEDEEGLMPLNSVIHAINVP